MATVNQLRDRIKVRLSRRTVSGLDSIIVDEMTHSQQEILEQDAILPNFLRHPITINKVGAHSYLNTATDLDANRVFIRPFLLRWADLTITVGANEIVVRRYDDPDQLDQLYPGEATFPKGYWWGGELSPNGALRVRPYVSGSLTYHFEYYGKDQYTPSVPDSNGETLWTKHAGDYLMHTTGLEIATFLRDKDALTYFSQKRQEAYTRFIRKQTADLEATLDLAMGE